MKLDSQWRRILKKAWSIRLMLLAGLLSGVEAILPLFSEAIPRGIFSVASILVISGAFIARLVAQKEVDDEKA